jgi:hypothetical protein
VAQFAIPAIQEAESKTIKFETSLSKA